MKMDQKHKEAMAEANVKAKDWYTVCPVCHVSLEGTLAELKAHKCEVPHDVHPR